MREGKSDDFIIPTKEAHFTTQLYQRKILLPYMQKIILSFIHQSYSTAKVNNQFSLNSSYLFLNTFDFFEQETQPTNLSFGSDKEMSLIQ